MELLRQVPAVLIFCNIFDPQEMKLALVLSTTITELRDAAAPTILVPHVRPESSWQAKNDRFNILAEAISSGIDRVISGDCQGLKLASKVRAEIRSHTRHVDFLNNAAHAHRERLQHAQDLEESLEEDVWYCFAFGVVHGQDQTTSCRTLVMS